MYGEGECFMKASRFDNGFTIEIMDPAIVKYNRANDKVKDYDKRKPYKSPWKNMVFKTSKELIDFLVKNVDKAVVASKADSDTSEYETAWDMATAKDD